MDEIQDSSIYVKPYHYANQYEWYIDNLGLRATPFLELDGEIRGHVFGANQVQIILSESGCFVPSEVATWHNPIVVPPGRNPIDFINVTAARSGLEIHAIYSAGKMLPAPDMDKAELERSNNANGLRTKSQGHSP